MFPPATISPILGRHAEVLRLDALLASVQGGASGTLLLIGEAGIGKTRLLDHAAHEAADLNVMRIAGVESEARLGFAALHRLLRPLLGGVDRLPAPQRDALGSAFGLLAAGPSDRYLVGLATLTLLADAATAQPVLCLVDDVQWLDRESAEALAFVGRRLRADAVGILLAGREAATAAPLFDGVPTARIAGLAHDEARALLAVGVPGRLDAGVAERIVADTGGNPLALIELAGELAAEQLAGKAPLPAPLPVGPLLEAHFLRQVRTLPAETQALLLLLSAASPDDPALLWRAAGHLGLSPEAADPALNADIVTHRRHVEFRHPLIRSAVHRGAAAEDRRRVHAALAAVSDPVRDQDRRAWHRAEATIGLDEAVAVELEAASERARARGGYAGQAAFLVRAAELSPQDRDCSARLVTSAGAYLTLGDPAAAQAVLDRAEPGLGDPVVRAKARQARATVEIYFVRVTAAPAILLDAAGSIAGIDAPLARRMLFEAMATVLIANHRAVGTTPEDVARTALASPAMDATGTTVPELLLNAYAVRLAVGYEAGAPLLHRALTAISSDGELSEAGLPLAVIAMFASDDIWDDEHGWGACRRIDAHDRATGALGALRTTLMVQATWEIRAGRFAAASACLDESTELAGAIGIRPDGPVHRVELLAWSGREAETRQTVETIRSVWTEHFEDTNFGDHVMNCLAVLENSLGRYSEALACALPSFEKDQPTSGARVLHEIVEAGVRSGDESAAKAALERLEERASASGTQWALGLLARCRALMAGDEHAEALYAEAVDRLGQTRIVTELARTHLLYGEWLRRRKRRIDARGRLRTAHDMFTAMGAATFAERARVELLATGERARKRVAHTEHDLTPQEMQVATLAAGGATNAEIAARLFITASTVEYHLNKVFRKLRITTRRKLTAALGGNA
ncbi:AAA family ATPase [Kitasatospora sp. NBC_00315]|uniref:helix-turn-helix transcriptional regulator n=1 Tax=Kitasatospora sp. NBC_00315 TaxID=2975963 RepID=UPI0032488B41